MILYVLYGFRDNFLCWRKIDQSLCNINGIRKGPVLFLSLCRRLSLSCVITFEKSIYFASDLCLISRKGKNPNYARPWTTPFGDSIFEVRMHPGHKTFSFSFCVWWNVSLIPLFSLICYFTWFFSCMFFLLHDLSLHQFP